GDISGFSGVIDVDESYFGGIRKGKKGKDAAVFNNQKQGKPRQCRTQIDWLCIITSMDRVWNQDKRHTRKFDGIKKGHLSIL
ncbi:MAG: hypothetical protein LBE97_00280, partial [Holosporales bacterium]|nr:hypothetical protein [Holosporales bacterium]